MDKCISWSIKNSKWIAYFRVNCPSDGGEIAGICTNPSLVRFAPCGKTEFEAFVVTTEDVALSIIGQGHGKWAHKQQGTLVQWLLLSTLMHCHLPDSRSSVALCCIILSMHFSCSRLMIQCSGSEVTWETQEQRQPTVQHIHFLDIFCLSTESDEWWFVKL